MDSPIILLLSPNNITPIGQFADLRGELEKLKHMSMKIQQKMSNVAFTKKKEKPHVRKIQ